MSPRAGVSRRRNHLRTASLILLSVVGLTLYPPAATGAQGPQVRLELLEQPPWHSPDDDLGIRLRVTNTGDQTLNGYQIQLERFASVSGRLELHDSFSGVSGIESQSLTKPHLHTDIGPGQSEVVGIDDKVSALGLTEDGVYPLTLSVISSDFSAQLASLTTEIVYYQSRPEDPLRLVLVVPLTNLSWKDPDGSFRSDPETGTPLVAEALDPESGWLSGLVSSMEDAARPLSKKKPGLQAAIAPSPRLMQELSDASTSFSVANSEGEADAGAVRGEADSVLGRLNTLLSNGSFQPLRTPYSFVDLPTMSSRFDAETLNQQLSEGSVVLGHALPDADFGPSWFFAPGSRWDGQSLDDIRTAGPDNADHTFFTRVELSGNRETGCPAGIPGQGLTYACPASVKTESAGRVNGFVADPGLQERMGTLVREGDDRLDLQRFFAESAMVHLEQPGVTKRVVQVSVPSLWHPSPYLGRRFLIGVARAPWLTTLKPTEGLLKGPTPRPKELVNEAPPLPNQPDQSYFDDIEDARAAVERYAEVGPPGERLQRMQRNLLVAQSRVWWSTEAELTGQSFATSTREEAEAELHKIRIDGLDTTLTSQAAPIEFTVFNDASYPVTVDVDLTSEKEAISIQPEELDALRGLQIEPGGNERVTVDAVAESSGIFTLNAEVETPQNGFPINSTSITIRSTNFNRIALGLTFGALAFLVLFSTLRWINRRRNRLEAAPEEPA